MHRIHILILIVLVSAPFPAQIARTADIRPGAGEQARPLKKTRPVTLTWHAPKTNTDGTPLDDLAGYRIYYGKKPHTYTGMVEVAIDDEDLRCSAVRGGTKGSGTERTMECTYILCGLDRESYYFAATAINSAGLESEPSNEIKK